MGYIRMMLLGTGSLPVWVHSLGMGRLYAMCWSSMSLSVKIGKAVSQTLPLPPSHPA